MSDAGSDPTIAAGSSGGGDLGSEPTIDSGGGASPAPPRSDELPAIPRASYAIRRELARGGMGRILLAEDRRLGRQVALKELVTPDAGLARRFAREVRVTARLAHPSIVTVYEAGHWPDGAPFYAMKLVAGKSLEKVVEERPALVDRLRLLPSFLQLAEAMAYAHRQGVIHRDLKPANVLIGDFGETVVIDWGLAKDTREAEDAESSAEPRPGDAGLTLHGAVMGTPGYMPPEQARGEMVDARADVYALGALMWHVLAGKAPFAGKNADEVLAHVLAGPPPPLEELAPGAPPELVAIVERAMAREAGERYPDAAALAEELARLQTGQLVSSHRYTLWDLARRWIKRHRVLIAAGAALIVGGLAVGSLAMGRIMKASDEARAERDRARGAELAALEEQGRLELLANHPRRAAVPLAQAYSAGRDSETLRLLLGEAMRAVDAEIQVLDVGAPVELVRFQGDTLVTMTTTGQVAIWDWSARTSRPLASRDAFALRGLALAKGGDRVVAWAPNGVRMWDTKTLAARDLDLGDVEADQVSSSVSFLAVGGSKGLRVYDFDGGPAGSDPHPVQTVGFSSGQLITSDGESVFAAVIAPRRIGAGRVLVSDCGGAVLVSREVPPAAEGGDPTWVLERLSLEGVATPITDRGGDVRWAICADDGTALVELTEETLGPQLYVSSGTGFWPLRLPGDLGDIVAEGVAAISPDGQIVVLGSKLGFLYHWEAKTGIFLGQIDAHERAVTSLQFGGSGRLASASSDGTVRVWRLERPAAVQETRTQRTKTQLVSPDGKLTAVARVDAVEIWQGETRLARLAKHEEVVVALAFSSDGTRLAGGARDGHVVIWDWRAGTVVAELRSPEGGTSLSFSASGTRLAAGGRDGVVRVFDLPQTRPAMEISAHTTEVRTVAWRPGDEETLLSIGDTQVLLWDRAQRRPPRKLDTEGEEVDAAWWSPDGNLVLGVGARGLRVWEAERGILLFRFAPRLGTAFVQSGEPRAVPLISALGVRWENGGSVALTREARVPEEIAQAVTFHVPWHLMDGALALRSRPVPVRKQGEESQNQASAHFDFADETIEPEADVEPTSAGAASGSPVEVLVRARESLWQHADAMAEPLEAARHLQAAAALLGATGIRAARTVDAQCKPVTVGTEGERLPERVLEEALYDHRIFNRTFDFRYALAARELYAAHRDLLGGRADGVAACLVDLEARITNHFERPSDVIVTGSLSPELIRHAMMRKMGGIRRCYGRALEKDPRLEGKLVLSVLINSRGDVEAVRWEGDAGLKPLGACIRPVIESLHLPRLSQGWFNFTYPLVFRSPG